MLIRNLQPGDDAEWRRMRQSLWPDCTDEEHDREMEQYRRDPTITVLLAERPGGKLCGFLEAAVRPWAVGCEQRPVGYIEGWYVDPDVRRQGVGRALVEAAEAWARSKGCKQIASDAHTDNRVSQEAHGALGYVETERLVFFKKDLI